MPRFDVKEHRRSELIDAAIESVAAFGLLETTLVTIAERAGVSPGLVNHYFNGKDELLQAAFRRISKRLAIRIRDLMPPSPSPRQRLDAIIDGCLGMLDMTSAEIAAWNALGINSNNVHGLAAFQRTINRRFRSNIVFSLRGLITEDAVDDAYLGLSAMIDGFWISRVIDAGHFDSQVASRICKSYLDFVCTRNPALI